MVLRLSLVLVLAMGCSSVTTPGASSGASASTSTAPTDPAVDAPGETPAGLTAYTEVEVQALFDDRCVKCHDRRSKTLDLSAPFAPSTVGVRAGSTAGTTVCGTDSRFAVRIAPGDRDASLLWHKVKGTQDCGKAMPYDKGNPALDATELERLGLYIDALAK